MKSDSSDRLVSTIRATLGLRRQREPATCSHVCNRDCSIRLERIAPPARSLSKKVKTALDENRLLILGAQVLFGFKLQGVFQEQFEQLSTNAKLLDCAGQVLIAITIGLLIAPAMQHRIVEDGDDTPRIHQVTSLFAGVALLPFEISLGL